MDLCKYMSSVVQKWILKSVSCISVCTRSLSLCVNEVSVPIVAS